MEKYWYILALKVVNDHWFNLFVKDVNFGNDTFGKYAWLENDKNVSLTLNSTYI